ncbi:MAG: hypothetical protein BWX86_02600 [Verrucomicrobia bacterium ADurb.Bin122]|nr:MAG: hypothetical protein BWX86_02600 [Verrucomicrobia bacterium ADurb.Bin122]
MSGVSVRTWRPGEALVKQAIWGLGIQPIFCLPVAGSMIGSRVARSKAGVPISIRHMRQLPETLSLGW